MKKEPLTPFESVILNALKAAEGSLTFEQFDALEAPERPPAKNNRNKLAVYIKEIRRKTGLKVANVRGVGYQIVK